MDAVVTALLLAQEADPAEEGLHIILSMLVVGLVFLGVIVLGQTFRYLGHRRAAKKRARRVY